ncbi:uncharacterized protein LOC102712867 [Oryza brachyantha]|uniref:uncharacterized protein LOC102712867 n=1 Tax=Oryza brachyantha TaxID=4533 RepID=UPI001AD9E7FD|nr:uncharacterized protein LOC102712867 [Oryza brachyantha]
MAERDKRSSRAVDSDKMTHSPPLMFVLVMDTPQAIIATATQQNIIPVADRKIQGPAISLYADDAIIFFPPETQSILAIKEIMRVFGAATGLNPNFSKSSITPIRTDQAQLTDVQTILGCQIKQLPITYLGLPLSLKRLTKHDLQPLMDRISKKVSGWKPKMLTPGDRLILIKTVLMALPAHLLSVLELPKWAVKDINRKCRGFLWKGQEEHAPCSLCRCAPSPLSSPTRNQSSHHALLPGQAFPQTPRVHLRAATSSPRAASSSRLTNAENLVTDFEGSPLAYHVLGHVRAGLGEAEAAIDPLCRARDLAPGDLGIALTLAKTYAAREQFDQAVKECKRALSLGNADLVDPGLHGVIDLRQMDWSKKARSARLSVAKKQLQKLLADCSSSQKEPSNTDWNHASDHFREQVSAVLTGASLAARAAPERDAVKSGTLSRAEDIAKEWRGSPLALHVSGHVRAALGEVEAALDPLCRARDLVPGDLAIAFTLAKTYAAREQFDLAVEECEHALSLGDADLSDPGLHAVFESRHLEPRREARISIAKQQLRELLADCSWNIVVPVTRDRWNCMNEEERRSFLTVCIEEMVAYYAKSSEQRQMRALSVAVDFAKDTRKWICWLCPQCKMVFLTVESFQSHVEDEVSQSQELKKSLLLVPKRISDEQAEFIKTWTVPSDVSPTEQAEREKIKNTFKHLMDQRALSADLFNNLVKYMKFWIGETTDHPQNLSCITSLDPVGFQVLGTCLDLLIPGLRVGDAVQHSLNHSDVAVDQDAFSPSISIDIEENVFRIADCSSNQDALFSWLSRPSTQDPFTSWISMRQACLDKGTHVLEKLNGCATVLIEKIKPKCGSIEMDKHENYFSTKVKVDIEIMKLDAEVDNFKKKLVEVCTCDYCEIILPAMKDYLWAKLCNDSPQEVLHFKHGAEASTENRVSVREYINVTIAPEIVLQEDDEKCVKDNIKGGDSTVPHDNVVKVLPGDSKVLQSDKKPELPPRANENTLESPENTPMEKENKTSSPSGYSCPIEGGARASNNRVTGTVYSENELKSLYLTLLSLWHLKPFSDKYIVKARLYPHFGVSGEDCMMCNLFYIFSAFTDTDDSKSTPQLKQFITSLIKFLNRANVSLKEIKNLAAKFTEIIFNMVHTSETATRVSKNSEEPVYRTKLFSVCPDHVCLSHGLFGMHKNARESTYFLNIGASELQNIEMKSFDDVIKSVDKKFHYNSESNAAHNHPPRFFTTAFSYPSENDSLLDLSGLLLSIAAPLDISPVYEGLQSECKYTMVSAVFRAEGQDICFTRQEEKWLVYDKTIGTVKDFDSWEKVLDEYSRSRSRLYPQIIFFERSYVLAH